MLAKQNQLLAALPPTELERLLPYLEEVPLESGAAIYESGNQQEYVYFPIAGTVSLQRVNLNDPSAEIAVVGNEGVVGIALSLGGAITTPARAVVQNAGEGLRLKADLLKQEFERHGTLRYVLLRYIQSLIAQMAKAAGSYRHHS
jgi:CRP-like cAMP-binding protein